MTIQRTIYFNPEDQLRLDRVRSAYREAGAWTTVSCIAKRAIALLEAHLEAHPADKAELQELAKYGQTSDSPSGVSHGRHH